MTRRKLWRRLTWPARKALDERDVIKRPWCWAFGHDWEENAAAIGPRTGGKVVPMRFCWRCLKGFRLP